LAIEVRQALERDADSITALYTELTNDPTVSVLASRISEIFNDAHNFLFVVTDKDIVRGSCFVTLCLDPMYGKQTYAVLENIIVSLQHQSCGLGSVMLKQVEQFCLDKDVSKIMLMSSAKQRLATRLQTKP